MRSPEQTSAYKKSLKLVMSGRYKSVLLKELPSVLVSLANDIPLPEKYHDHALTGSWKDHWECHIRPDLLLVYQKIDREDEKILILVKLGSHSEIFG